MSIATDMQAMADDLMRQFGVPATYKAGGAGEGVAVTVRCKPRRVALDERIRMHVMEISVRASEVQAPDYGDTFEIGGVTWAIKGLPTGESEITDHAMGALWQLVLTRDARPTLRGGVA